MGYKEWVRLKRAYLELFTQNFVPLVFLFIVALMSHIHGYGMYAVQFIVKLKAVLVARHFTHVPTLFFFF